MSVNIAGQDVSNNVVERGISTAALVDLVGRLAQVRNYVIADNRGRFTNESATGFFSVNNWRDQLVNETNQGEAVFSGAVRSLSTSISNAGRSLSIEARDPIGVLLRFPIEENQILFPDGTGNSLYETTGNAAGATNIGVSAVAPLTPGNFIDVPSVFIINQNFVPRYQVVAQTDDGSYTSSVAIDRRAENPISAGLPLRISTPVYKTFAGAMFDALSTVGLGSRLNSSFAQLDAEDQAANRLCRLFILKEERITLGDHLTRLAELGNLILTIDPAGNIGVQRGLAGPAQYTLTGNDILRPIQTTENVERLLEGYDVLFQSSDTEIGIASDSVSSAVLNDFAAVERFQPQSPNSRTIYNYNYLYNNETTARFFADEILNYYAEPKRRIICSVKRNFSGSNKKITPALGDNVSLSLKTVSTYINQPAVVLQSKFNERNQITEIELELNATPVLSSGPVKPVVHSVVKSAGQIQIEVDDSPGQFIGQVFTEKQFYKKTTLTALVNRSGTLTLLTFNSTLIGGADSIRIANHQGGLLSEYTEFF